MAVVRCSKLIQPPSMAYAAYVLLYGLIWIPLLSCGPAAKPTVLADLKKTPASAEPSPQPLVFSNPTRPEFNLILKWKNSLIKTCDPKEILEIEPMGPDSHLSIDPSLIPFDQHPGLLLGQRGSFILLGQVLPDNEQETREYFSDHLSAWTVRKNGICEIYLNGEKIAESKIAQRVEVIAHFTHLKLKGASAVRLQSGLERPPIQDSPHENLRVPGQPFMDPVLRALQPNAETLDVLSKRLHLEPEVLNRFFALKDASQIQATVVPIDLTQVAPFSTQSTEIFGNARTLEILFREQKHFSSFRWIIRTNSYFSLEGSPLNWSFIANTLLAGSLVNGGDSRVHDITSLESRDNDPQSAIFCIERRLKNWRSASAPLPADPSPSFNAVLGPCMIYTQSISEAILESRLTLQQVLRFYDELDRKKRETWAELISELFLKLMLKPELLKSVQSTQLTQFLEWMKSAPLYPKNPSSLEPLNQLWVRFILQQLNQNILSLTADSFELLTQVQRLKSVLPESTKRMLTAHIVGEWFANKQVAFAQSLPENFLDSLKRIGPTNGEKLGRILQEKPSREVLYSWMEVLDQAKQPIEGSPRARGEILDAALEERWGTEKFENLKALAQIAKWIPNCSGIHPTADLISCIGTIPSLGNRYLEFARQLGLELDSLSNQDPILQASLRVQISQSFFEPIWSHCSDKIFNLRTHFLLLSLKSSKKIERDFLQDCSH